MVCFGEGSFGYGHGFRRCVAVLKAIRSQDS